VPTLAIMERMSERLLAALLLVVSCRPQVPARQMLELNREVVREGKTDKAMIHCYQVAMMLLDEPIWDGEAEGFSRERLLERREEYRGMFRWSLIEQWLAEQYEPGSDLEIVAVHEFRRLSDLRRFLGVDPEMAGIPVVEEVRALRPGFEFSTWPADRVRYISRQLPSHFSAATWPVLLRGQELPGLELAERARVVDRWAVGYVSSHGVVYGTLLLRVRGLWALWPFVR